MANKPSSLLDTRVIYCGDNLEQHKKLHDDCIDYTRPRCVEVCRGLIAISNGESSIVPLCTWGNLPPWNSR